MLLAVLEVDAAAICASIPIFWPVMVTHLGGIFVTKEMSIIREMRYTQEDGIELMGKQYDDVESDLKAKHTGAIQSSEDHYRDRYVMQQVDPFGISEVSVECGAELVAEKNIGC
ncbi:hypothetical protein BKA67DRAFT_533406 [Truncatella angustata]|uniref:Uncharacterized protein n=1 Tax=Truncatella angustata TaxID=152316 RepID=A0A9P9A0D7_9PEZI|nr:uncharacterized protein BKA67DRAFT_533406 [Truncatella angustata]KAH6658247.1 hypothetical protein BKA67DRAFT_533406 [Truncatella angustata]